MITRKRGEVPFGPTAPLNEDMKALKLLDCPLYDGYPPARKIINAGGGGGQEKPAAA